MQLILKQINNNYEKQKQEIIKKVLKKQYNIDNYEICYTKNGKPYLKNNKVYFNISNDNQYFIIAFSKHPIGIDIQFYKKINKEFKKILNICEYDDKKCIEIFSLKEAIIKLEGLTLKDINKINTKKYKIKKIRNEKYVINIAMYKDRHI